jgi:heme oxygenase
MTPEGQAPLSAQIREASSVIHRDAERTAFMRVFFRGELPRDAYTEWLRRQWFIYSALEETTLALRDHPVVGRMYSPELFRTGRLEQDLDFFSEGEWRNGEPSPVTVRYVGRITELAETWPPGWVAHQWLRYMGNLGGQEVLRRLVSSAYDLDPEGTTGLAFHRYPEVEDPKAFLRAYHQRMDSMPLEATDIERIAAEGGAAFQLNIDLTGELADDFDIKPPPGPASAEDEALSKDVKHNDG